jgi:hypothetical protein
VAQKWTCYFSDESQFNSTFFFPRNDFLPYEIR